MYQDFVNKIPVDLIHFVLVVLFSLLIGLEQRSKYKDEPFESRFGTDRTFTLIGILGYVLYLMSPMNLFLFAGGGLALTALLATSYWGKIQRFQKFGITSMITALITYCLTPLIYSQPHWLVILLVVTVLWLTELKETLFEFTKKFDNQEFITLAKFLVIVGVVLPLLPDTPISAAINISPYKFWLAIVAVSAISYFSYLLKKFVFPRAGILLTGILGGLYSSTATTFILAKKSQQLPRQSHVAAAMILATSMMFLRIFLLAFFFNKAIALKLAPSFAVFVLVSIIVAIFFIKSSTSNEVAVQQEQPLLTNSNPLELKTALIFGVLFIFFALVTGFITKNYGETGIEVLSLIVGVTDIDPFIINLFQSQWDIHESVVVTAIIIAITSNNVLKMIYGLILSEKAIRGRLITGFGILILLGFLFAFVFKL
ncbi:MAG: DUF4010 domain-containing protein [Maribacter sp.]|nr:DUF4010 domain-containing protein [Maribacter sp.]